MSWRTAMRNRFRTPSTLLSPTTNPVPPSTHKPKQPGHHNSGTLSNPHEHANHFSGKFRRSSKNWSKYAIMGAGTALSLTIAESYYHLYHQRPHTKCGYDESTSWLDSLAWMDRHWSDQGSGSSEHEYDDIIEMDDLETGINMTTKMNMTVNMGINMNTTMSVISKLELVNINVGHSRNPVNQQTQCAQDSYDYIICGAGTSAQAAAKRLRQLDPHSTILMIAKEWRQPYMQSPVMLESNGKERITKQQCSDMRDLFQREMGVELVLGEVVKSVDVPHRTIELENNRKLGYGKLLVAIGSAAREEAGSQLSVSVNAEPRILGLNDQADEMRLLHHLEEKRKLGKHLHVSILGGGWNSALYASRLAGLGCNVTLICQEPALLHQFLPKFLTEYLTKQFKSLGVEFLSYAKLHYVSRIWYKDEEELLVYVARTYDIHKIEKLRTDFLCFLPTQRPRAAEPIDFGSFVEVDRSNGGLVCNAELCAASNIYVCGDAVSYPNLYSGSRRRCLDYEHAVKSAVVAANNMVASLLEHKSRKLPTPTVLPSVYDNESVRYIDFSILGFGIYTIGRIGPQYETYGYFFPRMSTHINNEYHGCVFYVEPRSFHVVGALVITEPQPDVNDSATGSSSPHQVVSTLKNYFMTDHSSDREYLSQKDMEATLVHWTRTLVRSELSHGVQDTGSDMELKRFHAIPSVVAPGTY